MGNRVKLEELVLKKEGISGFVDLVNLIGNIDSAIRLRSIGSETSIIYDKTDDAVYLNHEGKLSFVSLSPNERGVLKYLMQHSGERLKSGYISDGIGLRNRGHISRCIKNLRLRLSDTDPYQPKYIRIEGVTKVMTTYMFIAPQNKSGATQHNYISVPTPQ